jgi:preprotein translocase subunit Sss1
MDIIEENVVEPAIEFYSSSKRLLQRCTKPDSKGTQRKYTSILTI